MICNARLTLDYVSLFSPSMLLLCFVLHFAHVMDMEKLSYSALNHVCARNAHVTL